MWFYRAVAGVAVFASFGGCIQEPSLFVRLSGDGAGRVVSEPSGIDCGNSCGMIVDRGTALTLTAAPRTGSAFVGWRGGGCEETDLMSPCVPDLVEDTTITASFTQALRTLTIMKSGNGLGTVTSAPLGIACGSDCQETYTIGMQLELTATPEPGSKFLGWLGEDDCSSTSPCNIVLDRDATIGAIFDPM
jgi:hypothetical protein